MGLGAYRMGVSNRKGAEERGVLEGGVSHTICHCSDGVAGCHEAEGEARSVPIGVRRTLSAMTYWHKFASGIGIDMITIIIN